MVSLKPSNIDETIGSWIGNILQYMVYSGKIRFKVNYLVS